MEEDEEKLSASSESLQHVQFIDIQWLSTFGVNKLSALDYFYTSPFFDTSSNNQRLRIQGVEASRRDDILTSMTGLEFMLDETLTQEPSLYVIRKQHRKGPLTADLIDVYYIHDGIIFQAPGFYELLQSRLAKISLHTSEAFDFANSSVLYKNDASNISPNGAFHCWQSETEQKDALSTEESKRAIVLRDFPSFKTVVLEIIFEI